MRRLTGLRVGELGDEPTDLLRREKFSRALALTLGELAQQVLIGTPKHIGLDVGQPKPVAREHLDELLEPLVVDDALAVDRRVEVDDVNYAAERRVLLRDRPKRLSDPFANVCLECPD